MSVDRDEPADINHHIPSVAIELGAHISPFTATAELA
jgi:hypothetical protein